MTMNLENELHNGVEDILDTDLDIRDGRVVPSTTDVKLKDGGVRLDATFLYADIQKSSRWVSKLPPHVTAKVFKCFLWCATRIIGENAGTLTSFDGDRVMAVFLGEGKEECAAQVALMINYAVLEIVRPRMRAYFRAHRIRVPPIIKAGVGVDTGAVLAVRAGQREDNDLVWIGRAPNLAAELSSMRLGVFHSYISREVWKALGPTFLGCRRRRFWIPTTHQWLTKSIQVYMSKMRHQPIGYGELYG